MGGDNSKAEIIDLSTDAVAKNKGLPPENNYSLETLCFLINKQRVNNLENRVRSEFKELRGRQNQVKYLHQVLRAINIATDAKGNFDSTVNPEFEKMFEEIRGLGVDVEKGKTKYTRDERERLIDNLRMACDDLNIQNDMQLQTITRLTNERYESYQMARSIMKPLHEDKIGKARAIAGGR